MLDGELSEVGGLAGRDQRGDMARERNAELLRLVDDRVVCLGRESAVDLDEP
jgi:hypothetical protein